MYEIFEQLLKMNNVTVYQVSKATGVAQSSLSDWKKGKSKPKIDKMQKIADYFNVPVEYLLTGEKKSPDQMSEDEEIAQLVEELKNNPGKRLLFSKTSKATKEDIEKIIKMVDILTGGDESGGSYY